MFLQNIVPVQWLALNFGAIYFCALTDMSLGDLKKTLYKYILYKC